MNAIKNDSQTQLLMLLIVNGISTFLHYTDNFFFYAQYPQPVWITANSIYPAWVLLTCFAVAGYILYIKQNYWLAYLCLSIYSITGVSSLGHYLYGSPTAMSLKMNALILSDGIVGIGLLTFVIGSIFVKKEWQSAVERVNS